MPQGVSVNQASLPGDNRALEPPDSIPNSEVKRRIADGSVGLPHVRVGHRQASKKENPGHIVAGVLFFRMRDPGFPVMIERSSVHVITPAPQLRP